MLIEARNVEKSFKAGRVRAVRGVSFCLERGLTLGVVGESGSGKSTLAKLVLKLQKPDAGHIFFEGDDTSRFQPKMLKRFRQKVQVVFQDPFLSLDPRMRVGDILKEPFFIAGERSGALVDQKVAQLLSSVELPPETVRKHSHELSGGECQRVAIARALATDPELLICDEPVSALDALVRAQILNLFLKLQKERGMSYFFISHDLGVVRHVSDEILVMKDGAVCEMGRTDRIFSEPKHEYTQFLVGLFNEVKI